MTDRQGVEIDFCPQCRGVWLDRGELDKIIERTAPPVTPVASRERENDRHDDDDAYRREYDPKKKKRGFLGDIFDF